MILSPPTRPESPVKMPDEDALDELGDAAAHATLVLATSTSGIYNDGSRAAARSKQPAIKLPYKGSKAVS